MYIRPNPYMVFHVINYKSTLYHFSAVSCRIFAVLISELCRLRSYLNMEANFLLFSLPWGHKTCKRNQTAYRAGSPPYIVIVRQPLLIYRELFQNRFSWDLLHAACCIAHSKINVLWKIVFGKQENLMTSIVITRNAAVYLKHEK